MSEEKNIEENFMLQASGDKHTSYQMTRHGGIDKPVNNPQLFTSDPALVNQFVTEAQYLRKVDQNQVSGAEELMAQAQELMDLIKREYHLE